jgi:acyl dehydratase
VSHTYTLLSERRERGVVTGLYYEQFEVGETIRHGKRRTVTESDNQRFCDMTMYTMSLAVGLTIPDTTDGTIVANLSYDNVEHPAPVYHGDTVRAQTTVTDKRETSDGERGVVTMHVEAFVVDREGEDGDVLVCEFDRTALSLRREP